MKFDTKQGGLLTLFKPYQAQLLEHIWELNKDDRQGINSGQAHKFLLDSPDKKSRASVIFFLNDLVDDDILDYVERTGKGGHHRVYFPKMSREEFAVFVKDTITKKLEEVFPDD